MKLSLTKEQAKHFVELQEAGDILALEFYEQTIRSGNIEDTLSHNDKAAEQKVLIAATYLNAVISDMEMGCIKYDNNIDDSYRILMMVLVESAKNIYEEE